MKLKLDKIKELLAARLVPLFLEESFLYKKSKNWFIKTAGDFEYIFNLRFHSRSDHSAIEPSIFITHKPVEKAFRKILEKPTTNLTMGNLVGVIYNSPDGRVVVNNLMEIIIFDEQDIDAAVESLFEYFNDIAKPFFHKFSTLEAVDEIINNPPFDYNPAFVGGMFDDRCMRGLIINRLLNCDNFLELVSIYDECILTTMNETCIEDYNKVKDYLMYNKV